MQKESSLTQNNHSQLWFALSLLAAALFGLDGLRFVFETPYTVNNDARQYVFWMQRFLDPALFPNDLIARYFQAVSPAGYTALYRLFASLHVEPFLCNKLLPWVLGIVATIYCFRVCMTIFPVPFAGFLATVLLNQNLWLRDDLSSGTPRAFIYPLFLAFVYYALRQAFLPCVVLIVLQGLLYPHTVLLSVALVGLRLWHWEGGFPRLARHLRPYLLCGVCCLAAAGILLPYSRGIAEFDPVITVAAARNLPEFASQGRSAFFLENRWAYWLYAERTGVFPSEWQYVLLASFGCVLPLLRRYAVRFPLVERLQQSIILVEICLASLGLFVLAHALLFRLHLPSRYTHHSIRIILALADGIVVAIVVDAVVAWITRTLGVSQTLPRRLVTVCTGVLALALLLYPSYAVRAYPYRLGHLTGEAPALYAFLRQQPKNVLVASLTQDADFIPTLAQRSVLVSEEYAIPYHTGYYTLLRQRIIALLAAQYSPELAQVQAFIRQYHVDLWVVRHDTFTPASLENNRWLLQFQPTASQAMQLLRQGLQPALAKLAPSCTVFADSTVIVLAAPCLLQAKGE